MSWFIASIILGRDLKDLKRPFRVQTGKEISMTSRKVVNIVINSEREAYADLLCSRRALI